MNLRYKMQVRKNLNPKSQSIDVIHLELMIGQSR